MLPSAEHQPQCLGPPPRRLCRLLHLGPALVGVQAELAERFGADVYRVEPVPVAVCADAAEQVDVDVLGTERDPVDAVVEESGGDCVDRWWAAWEVFVAGHPDPLRVLIRHVASVVRAWRRAVLLMDWRGRYPVGGPSSRHPDDITLR